MSTAGTGALGVRDMSFVHLVGLRDVRGRSGAAWRDNTFAARNIVQHRALHTAWRGGCEGLYITTGAPWRVACLTTAALSSTELSVPGGGEDRGRSGPNRHGGGGVGSILP